MALFIILVGLIFSEKMLISHRCIRGLMPNLIKKSVKAVSNADAGIAKQTFPLFRINRTQNFF